MGRHEKHTRNVMYGVKFIQYGNSILFPNIIHGHHTVGTCSTFCSIEQKDR